VQANTRGNIVNSKLDFQVYGKSRTKNAERLLNVMMRLGNSNDFTSPTALRALHTGAIRPIFRLGAEVWVGPHAVIKISAVDRLEYRALRKLTVVYQGSI
jgi:hypothetical protein